MKKLPFALAVVLSSAIGLALFSCQKTKQATQPVTVGAPATSSQATNKVTGDKAHEAAGAPSAATATAATMPLTTAPFTTFELGQEASGGRAGAVAAAHPLATRAAAKVLHMDGNAVDALVAASFALTVVTPHSTGMGGGGFAIVLPANGKDARAFDFRETGPRLGNKEMYLDKDGRHVAKRSQRHGLAIGVPGYVLGLWTLHQKYGKRPWAELVKPAAEIARRGFKIGRAVAGAIAVTWDKLGPNAKKLLKRKDGHALRTGDILRQPKLAITLETIAEKGFRGFYEGVVAADIIGTVQRAGGKLDQEDMRLYEVRESPPLRGKFFANDVLTMPQPSAGGAQLLAMAELLESAMKKSRSKKSKLKKTTLDDLPMMHGLIEAMRRSFLMRLQYSGDPDNKAAKLDDVYPRSVRRSMARSFDPKKATVSARLQAPGKLPHNKHTSHVSIIDKNGMAVASTHTINLLFGSGILAPESGIFLNNELDDFSYTLKDSNAFGLAGSKANMYRPKRRPVSSMTPTIFLANGRPVLVIGAPGGTRIPTAVFQSAYRFLIDGMVLKAAIDAPRLHNQAFPDVTWVEKAKGDHERHEALKKLGHKTTGRSPWCNVQAVSAKWLDDGRLEELTAASDKRSEGASMVLK